MLGRLRQGWRELRRGTPGRRFEERYRRRHTHGVLRKALVMAAGVLLVLAGIPLLPLPGPGLVVIAAGAALIAQESRTAARALDWLERRLRSAVMSWRLPRTR